MSSPVRFQKIESNIPIGCIDSLKSPFFDGNFVFSHLIQYKNFDEHLPEVGACAVKAMGQELPRVGHLVLFNLWPNRGDFGRRCAKIVRARRLFPANFAFRCFANNNFKDVKFSAL